MSVELDTSELARAAKSLVRGLDARTGPVATATASDVARRLRSRVPVRTGRLRGTVTVTSGRDGASVHYGGALPYARYIERRTGAVEDAVAGADDLFAGAMHAAAELEVRRI